MHMHNPPMQGWPDQGNKQTTLCPLCLFQRGAAKTIWGPWCDRLPTEEEMMIFDLALCDPKTLWNETDDFCTVPWQSAEGSRKFSVWCMTHDDLFTTAWPVILAVVEFTKGRGSQVDVISSREVRASSVLRVHVCEAVMEAFRSCKIGYDWTCPVCSLGVWFWDILGANVYGCVLVTVTPARLLGL